MNIVQSQIIAMSNNDKIKTPITLFGSFKITYLPSLYDIKVSIITRRIPQALSICKLICEANSTDEYCCVPRITCLAVLAGFARET